MNTLDMQLASPPSRYARLSAVALLHVALGYVLVTGMAHRALDVVWEPLEVKLLKPDTIEPPPPPPPLDFELPPLVPPPPAYMRPPEVRVKPPPVPPPAPIAYTPVPPPPAPAPVAVVTAPAPPAPAPALPPQRAPPRDLSRPARLNVALCERPVYPAAARRAEVTGVSRISFRVDPTGKVVEAKVVRRSGYSRAHRMLDSAALEALRQCTFEAGRDRQGHPVGGSTWVDYVWSLE